MISILVPTRKRPVQLRRMIESVKATIQHEDDAEVICYVDTDDPTDYSPGEWFDCSTFVRGPRITMSDMWNRLIPHASGELFMNSDDDCVYRTPGWAEMVHQAFAECPDKILLVYGDDGGPSGKTFATHPIVHRRWIEIVGYFAGPGFSADFADTWPQDIAEMIGRKKFLPFVNEHMHYLWNKSADDETYRETRERMVRDNTRTLYASKLAERRRDAEKLRAAMDRGWSIGA